MSYRFLIVEDNAVMIDTLTEALKASFESCEVVATGFAQAPAKLKNSRPDAVILDLAEGVDDIAASEPAWNFVWNENFCPIVIHSAFEDGAYDKQDHPFRRYERKGRGSEDKVVGHLKAFAEEIEGVRKLREEIDLRIATSLREVSPLVWRESAGAERSDMLRRVTRRRVAASLDTASEDANLKAVEQFIYPPLEPTLLTGDILRLRVGPLDSVGSYRVVLTPSCDLVVGGNRKPVDEVLVARCVPVNDQEILRRSLLQPNATPQKIGKTLCGDGSTDMVVLPRLHGAWPAMVVDLKRLELMERTKVGVADVAGAETEFVRVASMDSPFRERIAWRFVATCGRPGLPDLDRASLEQDIVAAASPAV